MLTVRVILYSCVLGRPGRPRTAGISLGSLTTTKFLKGTLNLQAQLGIGSVWLPSRFIWPHFE